MGSIKTFQTIIFVAIFSFSLSSQQSRGQLENARLNIIKQLESTESQLTQIKNNKSKLFSEINKLELEIDSYEQGDIVADSNPAAVEVIEQVVEEETIEPLHRQDLRENSDKLRKAYNELLRGQFRNRLLSQNGTSFTSADQKTAYLTRWRIFKNFEEQMLAGLGDYSIADTLDHLLEDTVDQTENIKQTDSVVPSLAALKAKKTALMKKATDLSLSEKRLLKQLENQKAEWEKYNQAIENVLLNGGNASVIAHSSDSNQELKTLPIISGSGIAAKIGFLPWPLADARIQKRYGEQTHSVTEGKNMANTGVDLIANKSEVRSVYAGTILSIANIPGLGETVIIQHDNDYLTIYAQLKEILVTKGSYVNPSDVLGLASSTARNKATMHFEIWQGKKHLNPIHWLKNN